MIDWQWKKFSQLSTAELYEILKVRQQVFSVEQNCVYQDVDNLDKFSWHLFCWNQNDHDPNTIAAYLRVVYPTHKYKEPSIGRLLTVKSVRKTGLGKKLLQQALAKINQQYQGVSIRISAQLYLNKFYAEYGFRKVSEPYNEDGIPHIEMLKQW